MKFRPQIQLRFRSETQYIQFKDQASNESISVNEWMLLQIEKSNPGLTGEVAKAPAVKKVKPKAKVSVKAAKAQCPVCESKDVVEWGKGQHCNGCNRNF